VFLSFLALYELHAKNSTQPVKIAKFQLNQINLC